MTDQDLVRARIDALITRLEQANQSILSAGLNVMLHKRIGSSLAGRISTQTINLKARRQTITPDRVLDSVWNAVSDTDGVDRLLDECLTYLQAARSRGPDVPPDLSEIIDVLFEELAGNMASTAWRSYSVFSTEDSFDSKTEIIRLRYPLCDVWDIPVAVHEFGHFMSRQLIQKSANGAVALVFQDYKKDFLERVRNNQLQNPQPGQGQKFGVDWTSYLDEIFADVFATFSIGPAFACSCIVLRFDPLNAIVEADGRHPSYAKRVRAILQTLKRMDNEPQTRNKMRDAITTLESNWKTICKSAGSSSDLSTEDQQWIDAQTSNIYDLLKSAEPLLCFQGWDGAIRKQPWLSDPPLNDRAKETFSIAELLNSSWLSRMKPKSDAKLISKNFVALCRQKTDKYDQ